MDYAGAWRANGGKWDWALALADGSIVVWLGTDHAARIAAGATQASQVPDWVQEPQAAGRAEEGVSFEPETIAQPEAEIEPAAGELEALEPAVEAAPD